MVDFFNICALDVSVAARGTEVGAVSARCLQADWRGTNALLAVGFVRECLLQERDGMFLTMASETSYLIGKSKHVQWLTSQVKKSN